MEMEVFSEFDVQQDGCIVYDDKIREAFKVFD